MSTIEETAQTRKEQLLKAAATLFSEKGYYKTTTADIAATVGVTQPYIFHFFKSKEELYLAVLDKAFKQIMETFTTVEESQEELKNSMGEAFAHLLSIHRNEILLVMMAFSIPEPAIRDCAQQQFASVYEQVKNRFEQASFPDADEQARAFIGQGLTIALAETLNLPKLLPWYGHDDCG